MYFPKPYRFIRLSIRSFFWKVGGYRTGNVVVGFLSPKGMWSRICVLGFYVPRSERSFFYFDSLLLGYWLNRGAVLELSVLRLLSDFAKAFFTAEPCSTRTSFNKFFNSKFSFLKLGLSSNIRQGHLFLRRVSFRKERFLRGWSKGNFSKKTYSFGGVDEALCRLSGVLEKNAHTRTLAKDLVFNERFFFSWAHLKRYLLHQRR